MKYLVIGDGIAGATAAEKIRELENDAEVRIFTDESEPLYNRIMLKSYMKGDLPGKKFTRVHDKNWYEKRDIDLNLETKVIEVDKQDKKVKTSSKSEYSYDKLLIATGGSPRKLPQDQDYENLYYMWTMGDAERIKNAAEDAESAVVVGGGLLGIDLAVAFAENDAETYYLIRDDNWWHRGLDEKGAEIIHENLEEKGVEIVTNSEVEEIKSEDGKVEAVIDNNGQKFETDALAVAIGQKPNSDIVDVKKNSKNQIKTDKHLQTSDPDIYAAGNEVEYYSPVMKQRTVKGDWEHSEKMGELAGKNMVRDFKGKDLEQFDHVNTYGVGHFKSQFLAIGDWSGKPISKMYEEENHYRRLFYRDGRLVGAVMIGHTEGQEDIKKAIKQKRQIEDKQKFF